MQTKSKKITLATQFLQLIIISVTRLDFFERSWHHISYQFGPHICLLCGLFWNHTFLVKHCTGTNWKNGLFPTPGHTGNITKAKIWLIFLVLFHNVLIIWKFSFRCVSKQHCFLASSVCFICILNNLCLAKGSKCPPLKLLEVWLILSMIID